VIYEDPSTGLSVLPINVSDPQPHSSELLASAYVSDALAQLAGEYDLIVFDLPPIGPIVDVRIIVPMMDMMVLVVEWGRLPVDVIKSAIEAEFEVFERCGGVILNKVDVQKNKLYVSNSARSYLSHEYAKYYRTESTT
jgi:succinoglycan biosynthesis transport protein ExoP